MKVSAKLAGWVVSGADTADRLSEFAKTDHDSHGTDSEVGECSPTSNLED